MKYVKKAIPVEACALDGNHDEWLKDAIKKQIVKMNTDGTAEIETLERQARYMGNYLKCLEIRAEIEKIKLEV